MEIADIIACVQNPKLIKDPFFKNAVFSKDARGLLLRYTGGFTVVFPCIVNGEKWAFRCWYVPVKDAKERYSFISQAIQKSHLPYFCSFEYAESGLLVDDKLLPITKMKWVDGQNLKKYICSHYHESEKIKQLAKSFLDMIIELHSMHIAHGDLQHGNIMVSDSGQVFLVDYDSMYVPEMGTQFTDIITGLADYQHPARKRNQISSDKLDYFSELIIYTSLLAIAYKPDFVLSYKVEDSESLLFKATDFVDIKKSPIYRELANLKNKQIDQCLNIIDNYLSKDDINRLEPIENFLMSLDIDFPSIVPINEDFNIKWKSDGLESIELSGFGKLDLNGSKTLKLSQRQDFIFTLISKTGYKLERAIAIDVAHRAAINTFKADKLFSYASIPVRLSWECSNAKSVQLKGIGTQNLCGYIIVTPKKDTTYTLSVEDDFCVQSQSLTIRMLPLPAIKSLYAPTPTLTVNIGIKYSAPNFKINIPSPSFGDPLNNIDIATVPTIELSAPVLPNIPQLRESPFFVPLKQSESHKRHKNFFNSLLSIFRSLSYATRTTRTATDDNR